MKRRQLLAGGALAALGLPAAAELPVVLREAAAPTALAPQAALLSAARVGRRVLVAGERGIVLFSDDDGQRWTQATVPVQVSVTALRFADARNGWACGHFGVLLRTSDAGASWTLAMDGARAARLVLDAAADEAQRRSAERLVEEGPDKPFFDAAAADGRFFAVGAYGLALASNGGAPLRSIGQRLPNRRSLHLYGVRVVGERVYIAGEQGLLLRSDDRGDSFLALTPPYKGSFFGLLATRAGSLVAYGLRGNIWRSDDHGASWTQVPNPVPVSIGAALQRDDGTVMLLAQNGDLLLSRDDARSFERRPAAPPLPAAAMAVTEDGQLVVAGLRGVRRQSLT